MSDAMVEQQKSPIEFLNNSVPQADETQASPAESEQWANIPACIFNNSRLSGYEAICKYLKQELKLRNHEIAKLTNRDDRTVWDSLAAAGQKMPEPFILYENISIPLSVVASRELSPLESITAYLKEECQMRFCAIARAVNRDDRTVWTAYSRARKKRDDHGKR